MKLLRIAGMVAVTAAVLATAAGARIEHYFVNVTVNGPGHVTGSGSPSDQFAGTIDCPTRCRASFVTSSTGTLSASPDDGATFVGWGGNCSGTGGCTFTAGEAPASVSVSATFESPGPFALSVGRGGTGSGSVSGSGISCPGTCSVTLAKGSTATLSATPALGSTFAGWEGDCSGSGGCNVSMDGPKSVTAVFNLPEQTTSTTTTTTAAPINYRLSVSKDGTGLGAVSGSGIDCGAICAASLLAGTPVTLTAAPATGSLFAGWGGACSGTAPTCTLTLTADAAVTATFSIPRFKLTVEKSGPGYVGAPGIDCGPACSTEVDLGTTVVLVASPAPGGRFLTWDNACGSGPICKVKVEATQTIIAKFQAPDRTPPTVRVFAAVARRGKTARLRFSALDGPNRPIAVSATVSAGSRTLARHQERLPGPGTATFAWRVPLRAPSSVRFCASAIDASGNRSARVCTKVVVK